MPRSHHAIHRLSLYPKRVYWSVSQCSQQCNSHRHFKECLQGASAPSIRYCSSRQRRADRGATNAQHCYRVSLEPRYEPEGICLHQWQRSSISRGKLAKDLVGTLYYRRHDSDSTWTHLFQPLQCLYRCTSPL